MLRRSLGVLAAGGLAALAASAAFAPPAHACGGFFCDNSQPVNQAAERIIFTHGADGSVTAIIQIQDSGEAERFAWVLPVAGNPTVGVSSNAAFQRLQAATNPQYRLNTIVEGSCRDDDFARNTVLVGNRFAPETAEAPVRLDDAPTLDADNLPGTAPPAPACVRFRHHAAPRVRVGDACGP